MTDSERLEAYWLQLYAYSDRTINQRRQTHRNLHQLNDRWRDAEFAKFEEVFRRTCLQLTRLRQEVDLIAGGQRPPVAVKPAAARIITGPQGLRRLATELTSESAQLLDRLRAVQASHQGLAETWSDARYAAFLQAYLEAVRIVVEYCAWADRYSTYLSRMADRADRGGG